MISKLLFPALRRRNPLEVRNFNAIFNRYKSTKSSLTKSSAGSEVGTDVRPLAEKVKETTKTASYLGVILLGVGVTGTLFYAVFNELFSSRSPNNIYTAAVKKCLADTRIEDKLGYPIKAYGEETRRGRRQHPNYSGFIGKDGKKHLRMQFYLQGTYHKGTAQLEMIENASGDFEYRYLLVQVDDMARNVIVLEDNRYQTVQAPTELLM
ncbi:PREDICTED: mitochondrial import inner membrane translocase subunit Tim21 [Nicrophorus vespilloides]|uniref:Mitochondrial import inner membrane translocase subunit Tim21 n=1 Tax=Nicrophorus vespilloides TaxID=110193 RepID=A0ABM1N5E1_NICVS|nr:PREDICTED: mitochondrial import inner membrane translocase subunit Tim21 [Nicrophorus vespilloides]